MVSQSINEMAFEPCLTGFALSIPALVVAVAVAGPDSRDIMAILGAAPATWLVILEARKKDRSFGHTTGVFVSAMFSGAVAPGACVYWLLPSKAETLTWHGWALMGFVFGLIGWAIAMAIIKFANRNAETAVVKLATRWVGRPDKKNETTPEI